MSEVCEQQLSNPNPLLYDDALWDVAKGDCSYYRTNEGVHVCMCSSAISALSSMLIIYIILISSTKLSSIYHRILFAMSICDVMYSTSSCLATLPMPAPGKDKWTDILNIPGPRMGNVHTCTAQGFLFQLGCSSYYHYYTCLLVYYLFAVGIKMSEENVKKYLEPFFHALSIFISLYSSVPPLLHGDYNASFKFPVCISSPKPWFCGNEDNTSIECVRGKGAESLANVGKMYVAAFLFLCYFVLLSIICIQVFMIDYHKHLKSRRIMKFIAQQGIRRRPLLEPNHSYSSTFSPQQQQESSLLLRVQETVDSTFIEDQFQETKTIIFQAMLYAISTAMIFASWISLNQNLYPSDMFYKSTLFALSYSQGFSNLLIFLFHKVYNLKIGNPEISTKQAILDIFENGGIHDAIIITEMDMVVEYHSTVIQDTQDIDHHLTQDFLHRTGALRAEQLRNNQNQENICSNRSVGMTAQLGSTRTPVSSYLPSTGGTSFYPHGNDMLYISAVGEVDNVFGVVDEDISLLADST